MVQPIRIQVTATVLEIVEGDLTTLDTAAIVNAANSELAMGGGVAGAIARRGGPAIQEECDRLGSIGVGEAVSTGAGRLAARRVIHVVGPRMGEGDEDEKLATATRSALALAEDEGLESIGFPAVSSGIFGFPIERCAQVMLGTVIALLTAGSSIERVVFCLFGEEAFGVFADEIERLRVSR